LPDWETDAEQIKPDEVLALSVGYETKEEVPKASRVKLEEEEVTGELVFLYGHPHDPNTFEECYADTRRPLVKKILNLQRTQAENVIATPDGSELTHV
jgi:hypothetical protein